VSEQDQQTTPRDWSLQNKLQFAKLETIKVLEMFLFVFKCLGSCGNAEFDSISRLSLSSGL